MLKQDFMKHLLVSRNFQYIITYLNILDTGHTLPGYTGYAFGTSVQVMLKKCPGKIYLNILDTTRMMVPCKWVLERAVTIVQAPIYM